MKATDRMKLELSVEPIIEKNIFIVRLAIVLYNFIKNQETEYL